MSVYVDKHKIFYGPVPKVACSSLKLLFFEIENGFAFRNYRMNERWITIHGPDGYKSDRFEDYPFDHIRDMQRFTIVRDPVSRFLSGYLNRVVRNGELKAAAAGPRLQKLGLPEDPDFDTFVKYFPRYFEAIPTIKHHFAPMTSFIGGDSAFWTRVYRFDELGTFARDMAGLSGEKVKLKHANRTKTDLVLPDPSFWQLRKIKGFYKFDYAAYAAYF
jgi:sulfotransferase famil protein